MAISVVQSKTGTSSASLTLTITLTSSTTAGNCLVAAVNTLGTHTAGSAVSGIKLGGAAGNWAKATGQDNLSGGTFSVDGEIWTDQNCAGGQTGVVITCAGSAAGSTLVIAAVYEVSGLATSSAVDQTISNPGSATSYTSTATATTTAASEIWFGVIALAGSSGTITPSGSPWNNTSTITVAASAWMVAGWQIVSSTGTATYSGTLTGTGPTWVAAAATIKGAAAAFTPPHPLFLNQAIRRASLY